MLYECLPSTTKGTALLVGCGESAKECDLSETDIHKMGVGSIGYKDIYSWGPLDTYCTMDPPFGKTGEISAVHPDLLVEKRIHKVFARRYRSICEENHALYKGDKIAGPMSMVQTNLLFSPPDFLSTTTYCMGTDMSMITPNCRSSLFPSLKWLYDRGFRTVYLVGCDFNPPRMVATPYITWNFWDTMRIMLNSLKPYFDQAGFFVRNCSKDSSLTCFPYVPYKEAINPKMKEDIDERLKSEHTGEFDPTLIKML